MAYHLFIDGAGVSWEVWDTRPKSAGSVREQYSGGWLTFVSGQERRRLHPVPANFGEATRDDLLEWLTASERMSGDATRHLRPRRARQSRPGPEVEQGPPPETPGETDPHGELEQRTRSVVEHARDVIRAIGEVLGRD